MNLAMALDCQTQMSEFKILVGLGYDFCGHVLLTLSNFLFCDLPNNHRNFYNLPTYECMDYTNLPRVNTRPGRSNLRLLADIYGTFSSSLEDAVAANNVVSASDVPSYIMKQWKELVESAETLVCDDCTMDLGDGYWLVIHQFIPQWG